MLRITRCFEWVAPGVRCSMCISVLFWQYWAVYFNDEIGAGVDCCVQAHQKVKRDNIAEANDGDGQRQRRKIDIT